MCCPHNLLSCATFFEVDSGGASVDSSFAGQTQQEGTDIVFSARIGTCDGGGVMVFCHDTTHCHRGSYIHELFDTCLCDDWRGIVLG